MAATLVQPYTQIDLETIASYSEKATSVLTKSKEITHITSDERFIIPFEQTILHGLYSGESHNSKIIQAIKIFGCKDTIYCSYEDTPAFRAKEKKIKRTIKAIFRTAYRLGDEFSHLPNLRTPEGKIEKIPRERGYNFIYPICEGLQINTSSRKLFAKNIWKRYSQGQNPSLFIK